MIYEKRGVNMGRHLGGAGGAFPPLYEKIVIFCVFALTI